jgi:membrane-associated phospholipid phosphatase
MRTKHHQRSNRAGSTPGFENLEGRLLLASGFNAFAQFGDLPVSRGGAAAVTIHLRSADFTMPRQHVILGLAAQGMQEGVEPRPPAVVAAVDESVQTLVRRTAATDGQNSLTLTRLVAGDFTVRWRARQGTLGPTQLDVFLAGDANADFRVDDRDLDIIRDRAGVRVGDPRYWLDADVNRDGVIAASDLRLAARNRGAATTVRPIVMTASLSPDSDPDGNGVVLRPQVTIVGQTLPGATVQLDSGENESPNISPKRQRGRMADDPRSRVGLVSVADASGRFQFNTELAPGLNTVRVTATNGFGQSVVVERTVRVGDVILDWNASLLNVIRDWTTLSNDPYPNRIVPERPPVAARNLAMVHAAMFDAVNAIERTHQPYQVDLVAPDGASPVAAASAAAHRVASNLYRDPDELAVFDAALAEALATVADGPAETLGIELGRQVGDAILALRANDGASDRMPYTPGTEPGDWNRTFPDFLPPLLPQWPNVTPFAMTSGDQFRPAPPPALDSAEYAAAVNEVKAIGSLNSATRTADQTEIALFWADGAGTFTPPGHWNQIAADIALEHGNTLAENARLFALLNIALADAGIACWDAKYAYNLWRPIGAIRNADFDGNDATTADPSWTTLIKTPPFPTYTSGHSTFSGAAAEVLSFIFGPNTSFTSSADAHSGFTQRPLNPDQVVTRAFASFDAAADEAARSRLYGGIHFDFDNAAGLAAGRALGAYVTSNLLLTQSGTPT